MDKIPEIIPVERDLNEDLLKHFKGEKDGYVQVGPKKWFLPIKYQKLAKDYKEFEVRSDDVWVIGIPRSGTTVTQNIVWLLTHNLDYGSINPKSVKFFENFMVMNDKTMEVLENDKNFMERFSEEIHHPKNNLNYLNNLNERRVIKSHLPFELLPNDILKKGCKIVYVCRYPKDVVVSYYHLQRQLPHINFVGDFKKYWEFFRNGNCMFGPYFEHVKQGWNQKNSKNVLFVFYEDFRKDPKGYVKKISEFLEKPLNDAELVELLKFNDISSYKKLEELNNVKNIDFVRKGRVGGWKEYFTEEMCENADKWIDENTAEIGFEYPL